MQCIPDTELRGRAMPGVLRTARGLLMGRTIVDVAYYACDEGHAWPVIRLDDGTVIIISQDDEANGPGSGVIEGRACSAVLCRTFPAR